MARQGKAPVLTPQEMRAVLKLAELTRHSKRNVAMISLSFGLALRACEIQRLKLENILESDGITLVKTLILPKTMTKNKITNEMPLVNKKVRAALLEYISYLYEEAQKEKRELQLTDPLFPSQKGGHFRQNVIVMFFRKIYDMAKLHQAKSHSGRRTGITYYHRISKDLTLTKIYARHKSIKQTASYIEIDHLQLEKTLEQNIY